MNIVLYCIYRIPKSRRFLVFQQVQEASVRSKVRGKNGSPRRGQRAEPWNGRWRSTRRSTYFTTWSFIVVVQVHYAVFHRACTYLNNKIKIQSNLYSVQPIGGEHVDQIATKSEAASVSNRALHRHVFFFSLPPPSFLLSALLHPASLSSFPKECVPNILSSPTLFLVWGE